MKKKVDSFMEKLEHLMEIGGTKKDIVLLVISGVATILSLLGIQPLPFDIMCVAIILCGVPIVMEAIIGLVTEFDIKADVLVSLALIASVCIGEYFAAGEVAVIMQLGSLLEELTVAKARAGIERLVRLTPRTARVISGGTERVIPAQEVRVGDVLRVLPGESVPVDGIITAGQTSVNQAVMTGESLPVDKAPGDEVSSGTVNQFGAFDMRATRVGEDSSIQRMIRLVQPADAGKAKIVGIADRWATSTCPARGTTVFLLARIRPLVDFNPRAPRGARPPVIRCKDCAYAISIHVPREGHDARSACSASACHLGFNPRAPRGARLPLHGCAGGAKSFQSTCPARGTTADVNLDAGQPQISIHVPREGHDALLSPPPVSTLDFNPRAPRGARRPGCTARPSRQRYFNPRAPRGARPPLTAPSHCPHGYFNPRAPRGARRGGICLKCQGRGISIHVPREGHDA